MLLHNDEEIVEIPQARFVVLEYPGTWWLNSILGITSRVGFVFSTCASVLFGAAYHFYTVSEVFYA